MTSLLGCSGEDFASVLRSLGYRMERTAGAAAGVPRLRSHDGRQSTETEWPDGEPATRQQ